MTSLTLNYFGGPIIENIQVFTIYYGNVPDSNKLNTFYSAITNSNYMDILKQYKTPSQNIGYGTLIGSYQYNPTIQKAVVDDNADIAPFLFNLVLNGTISPNKNTYYAIHFAPDIAITKSSFKSCEVFCAYHGTYDISSFYSKTPYLYYGIMPDLSGACKGICGGGVTVYDNTCLVASHELTEAITDPGIGVGNIAWYGNAEIADDCSAAAIVLGGDGKNYTVQEIWSNEQNACVATAKAPTSTTTTTTKAPTTTTITKASTTTTTKVSTTTKVPTTTKASTTTTTTKASTTTTKAPTTTTKATTTTTKASTTSKVLTTTKVSTTTTKVPTTTKAPTTTKVSTTTTKVPTTTKASTTTVSTPKMASLKSSCHHRKTSSIFI